MIRALSQKAVLLSAFLIVALYLIIAPVSGASITWDGGGSDNDWSTCENWSGDVCPTDADIAIFDGTSTKDATIDASFGGEVSGLQINSGYSGTITMARSLTVGSDDFSQATGTFAMGSETLTLNTADFTISGGTYDDGTGTVVFDGNASSFDINTSLTLYNVTVETNNAFQPVTIASGDTLTVVGTLTFTTGAIDGPGSLEMEGSSTVVGSTGTKGTAVVEYLIAGNQTITGSGGWIPGMLVNKPSDSLTQSGDVKVFSADFELQSGTYVVGANTFTLDTADFTISGGTFTSTSSTVVFDGNAQTFDVNTSLTLNNVTFDTATSSQPVTIASGDTMVVTGTLTFNTGKVDGPGSLEMEGASTVVGSTGTQGSAPVEYLVAGNQTIAGSGGFIPGILVNKPSDSLTQSGDVDVHSADFELQSGTYVVGANTLTLYAADFTISGGTFTSTDSTLLFTNNASTIDINTSLSINNLTIQTSNDFQPVTISSGDTITVIGTLTFNTGAINGPGSLKMEGYSTVVGSTGTSGTAVVEYLLAGDQTITASGGEIPGILVNKPSDSVTLSGDMTTRDGNFELQSGTFDAGTGTMTLLTSDFTMSGGTFTPNTGTLKFDGNAQTFDVNTSLSLYSVTFDTANDSQVVTIASGDTMVVTGTLTLNTGGVDGPGSLEMRGSSTVVSATGTSGEAPVRYLVTGDQTITSSGGEMPGIFVNKSSDNLTLSGDVVLTDGNYEMQDGTFNAGSGTITLKQSDFTTSGGTFNADTSTIYIINNASSIDVNSSVTFNNFTMDKSNDTHAVTIASGDTVIVTGSLSLQDGDLNGGTLEMQGTTTTIDSLGGGTTELTFSGSASQTYQLVSGDEPDGNVTINKSGGSLALLSSFNIDATGQTLTIAEGTLDLDGFALTVDDALTVESGGVLQLFGSETITRGSLDLQSGSTVTYTGDDDSAADAYTLNTLTTSYHHLTINSDDGATDSFAISASPFTVGGNFTLTTGTVTGGTATINVAGNWANSGTFTANTSSVVLNGTSQTISGSTTFNNLTKSVSSADTLTFTNGTTQTITGTMALDGDSGQLLSLRSDSDGDQWIIDPQGTRTIEYLDVKDSNNTNATVITVTGLNITDSGNNTNWGFNSAPAFSVTVSDGGSSGSSPTNVGASVTFTATATDGDGDQYYLAVCKTDAATAGSNDAPTCDGGSWAISVATDSASEASITYTALVGDVESNAWYAFVCDKTASSPACSSSSQGSGDNGSPFKVNHAPSYSSASSSASEITAGDSVTISTTASDSDSDTSADTVNLYVCKDNDATNAGCGAGGDWCSATSSASDPSCSFSTATTQSSPLTYYTYIYDSHGLAASGNPMSASLTVNRIGGIVLLPLPEIEIEFIEATACEDKQYLLLDLKSAQPFRVRFSEVNSLNFTNWLTYTESGQVRVPINGGVGQKQLLMQRIAYGGSIQSDVLSFDITNIKGCLKNETSENTEHVPVDTISYHLVPDQSRRVLVYEQSALKTYVSLFKVLPNDSDSWRLLAYLAYGGRVNNRSLEKESLGIIKFVAREKRLPSSNYDWRIVAVLGYGVE